MSQTYSFKPNLINDQCLSYLNDCLDKSKYECWVDIPGCQTAAQGTIPAELCVTTQRPDLVVYDRAAAVIYLWELTIPSERNIDNAHKRKLERYEHFYSDITAAKVVVEPFEIGAATGQITKRNKEAVKNIHKFVKRGITLKNLTKNLSSITVSSSYYIWNARKVKEWENPGKVGPRFT